VSRLSEEREYRWPGATDGSSIGWKACCREIRWSQQRTLIWEASWWLPLCDYLFLALVILIAIRFVVGRLGLRSMFANPPLAEAALYICILASLITFWI
jgi:hypothetical protein